MKIRLGFVSNSSSSSFLIPINALNDSQILSLQNHIEITNSDISEKWEIVVTEKCVYGFTFFDNFDMHYFIQEDIKLTEKYIYWGGLDSVKYSMTETGYENYELDLDKINQDIKKLIRKNKLNKLEYKQ
jgi:hypothetical protein